MNRGGEDLDKNVVGITNKKFAAVAYIDDRALRFTNWRDMRQYF